MASLTTDQKRKILAEMQGPGGPNKFFKDVLGVRQTWAGQDEVLDAVTRHNRVAVPSGHALGKDYLSARLMLWFLYWHMPSIVIATAPTDRQVSKVIWGELTDAYSHALKPLGGRLLTQELIVDEKLRWYALGFTTKDTKNSIGKFQGFHSPNVLLLFSEAQAIDKSIWDQAESLMTGANVKWLAIGNPLVAKGSFYDACRPKSGWKVVQLDCEKSPNVVEGREVIPGLCSREFVDRMHVKYPPGPDGRNHPVYDAKVRGIFPPLSERAFIQPEWLDWAYNCSFDLIPASGPKIAGVDVAAGGVDKTVITIRQGYRVVEVRKFEKRNTMETAGEIVMLLNQGVARVYVDAGGVGQGVYDRVVEQGYGSRIVPINFGARPYDGPDDLADLDPYPPTKRYRDLSTQMYAHVATLLEKARMAMPEDEDLSLQLLSREMLQESDGKKKLEPKKLYTDRTGNGSPDEADSLVLAFCPVEPETFAEEPVIMVQQDEGLNEIFT